MLGPPQLLLPIFSGAEMGTEYCCLLVEHITGNPLYDDNTLFTEAQHAQQQKQAQTHQLVQLEFLLCRFLFELVSRQNYEVCCDNEQLPGRVHQTCPPDRPSHCCLLLVDVPMKIF